MLVFPFMVLFRVTFEFDYETLKIKVVRLFSDGTVQTALITDDEQRALISDLLGAGFELQHHDALPTFERHDVQK